MESSGNSIHKETKHYYQGGYDYEFVQSLPKRFECPICLLCQRDPHQTSCGHRFCHSCILTWLSEGRTCPDDNCSLGEGDIFPDSMANREILQLMIHCPRRDSGCGSLIHLSDVDNHLKSCRYSSKTVENIGVSSDTCPSCGQVLDDHDAEYRSGKRLVCPNSLVACPYRSAGCVGDIKRKDLSAHVTNQTPHHVSLVYESLQKVKQNIESQGSYQVSSDDSSLPGSSSLREGSLNRDSGLRLSGSNIHSTQKLIKDLFQRIVALEQKNCRLEIASEVLGEKLKKVTSDEETRARFCNGRFVWKLANFPDLHHRMRLDHNYVVFSPGFYTSAYGYKACLRCNIKIINGEEHLGVFIHIMRGENDETLSWPFRGQITLTAVREIAEHFRETIRETPFASKAFEKPCTDRNETGFGFTEFIRANSLYSGRFIRNDNTLILRVELSSLEDSH